jgi:hypothetical protein
MQPADAGQAPAHATTAASPTPAPAPLPPPPRNLRKALACATPKVYTLECYREFIRQHGEMRDMSLKEFLTCSLQEAYKVGSSG